MAHDKNTLTNQTIPMTDKTNNTKTTEKDTRTTKGKRASQQISYDDFETKGTFRDLLPRLNANDYAKLKRSILKHGCRDPLVIWRRENAANVLVDGHHRYDFCSVKGIPYDVKFVSFDNEDEAIKWMLDNQRSRRNLSKFQLAMIALEQKEDYKKLAKAHQHRKGEQGYQNSDKQFHVTKELAKLVGISHDTMGRIDAILMVAAENPDNKGLQKKVEALRKGKSGVSVNSVYAMVKDIRNTQQEAHKKPAITKTQSPNIQIIRAISRLDNIDKKLSKNEDRINLYERVLKWAKDKYDKSSS